MAGLYVHIPFCASRCIYCDFFSTTRLADRECYVEALQKELRTRSDELASGTQIATIYLGGGTPSMLRATQVAALLSTINGHYSVTPEAEVSMECNPEDITPDFLSQIKQTGVNRLSVGIQTFSDKRLHFLHRRHSAAKAIDAVRAIREVGFGNVSVDLMFGFPGETLDEWMADIEQALTLDVEHLSAYSLTYETGTPLHQMVQRGKVAPIGDDLSLAMYEVLIDKLQEAGYEHYEVSNFCKPGFHSRHNSSYWQGIPYIGIGAGAHSYSISRRRWNVTSIDTYIKGVDGEGRYFEEEELDANDHYNEYVMTRLRTASGIERADFANRFSKDFQAYFDKNCSKYLADGTLKETNGRIRLSRKGLYIADTVISDLFMV